NSLFSVDLSGHYFSSWYIKEYLFPRMIGWNPFFFFGFPQNQFYQPLFSYATALFSFLIPLEYAFKTIFSIVLLLTPVSFYYFARAFKFSKNYGAAIMLIMYAILFIDDSTLGGTFISTINTGLVTNALGLMLFFFFFAFAKKSFIAGKVFFSSLFLTLLILSHLMSSIAAIIVLLALLVTYQSKKSLLVLIKTVFISALLSSFWLIPAVAKTAYVSSFYINFGESYIPILLIALGFSIYYLIKKDKTEYKAAAYFVLALTSALAFFDYILREVMHYYRFKIFIFLVGPVLFFSLFKKERKLFLGAAICLVIFVMFTCQTFYSYGETRKVVASLPEGIEGRILILPFPQDQSTQKQYQQLIPFLDTVEGVRGVYQESSKNLQTAYDLELEINTADTSSLIWNKDFNTINSFGQEKKVKILSEQFRMFNINYVITPKAVDDNWVQIKKIFETYSVDFNKKQVFKYEHFLFHVSDNNLVEVLHYTPRRVIEKDWNEETTNWLFSENLFHNIFADEQVPPYNGNGEENAELLEKSRTGEYMKIKIDSNTPVPVLVKVSEFPNWKAYSEGKEIPIYKTSGYLMLVNAKGIVEFKYEDTWSDTLGNILSVVGIVLLVFVGFIEFGEKRKS
ncbi:MAG: hypothetical protein NTY48_07235, partial [Candidatus Diapherotrites archaeon]|nr:hypothetical protein [Candidatus Diapherotrites archaeon]